MKIVYYNYLLAFLMIGLFAACDNQCSNETEKSSKTDSVVYDLTCIDAKSYIYQNKETEGLRGAMNITVPNGGGTYMLDMWNYGTKDTILWEGDYIVGGGKRCLYDDGGDLGPVLSGIRVGTHYLQDVILLFLQNADGTYSADLTCTLPSGKKHHVYSPVVMRRHNYYKESENDLPYPEL